MRPITSAMRVHRKPATRPTTSEVRAPYTSWEKTSSPRAVVPSQCAADGPSEVGKSSTCGPYGAITGASSATRTNAASITSPSRHLPLRQRITNQPGTRLDRAAS